MKHSTTLHVGLDMHKDMIAVAHVSGEPAPEITYVQHPAVRCGWASILWWTETPSVTHVPGLSCYLSPRPVMISAPPASCMQSAKVLSTCSICQNSASDRTTGSASSSSVSASMTYWSRAGSEVR